MSDDTFLTSYSMENIHKSAELIFKLEKMKYDTGVLCPFRFRSTVNEKGGRRRYPSNFPPCIQTIQGLHHLRTLRKVGTLQR